MSRAVVILAGLWVGGCYTFFGGPAREPDLILVRGEQSRVVQWIDRARSEGERRDSLRAYGRVRVESQGSSGRFREVVLVARPSCLRFETLNFLGQTQSLLTTNGERFAFFDGQRMERGDAPEDLLGDRLGLDVAPEQAISLLLAAPPLAREAPERIFAKGDERVVEVANQRIEFSADGTLLGVESLDPLGRPRWVADYSDWRDLPGGRYPMKIGFHFPRTEFRLEIELEDVELNPELDPALFRIAPNGRD